jgi:hypothetical protein
MLRSGPSGVLLHWASGLRFPWLLLLTTVLFALNLFIPDALPLADELLMGLIALLLASLRKKKPAAEASPGNPDERRPGL